MDCIQTVLLSALSQIELALGCAELTVNTPCQVVLGGSLHVRLQSLAQQFCKLSCMLSLFVSCLLPVQTDFRIALTMCDASHAQIHTNLRALAVEVCLQLLQDVFLILSGYIVVVCNGLLIYAILMLSCQLQFAFYSLEHLSRCLTYRALLRSSVAFINVTTYSTYKLSHN